ncbi:porin family protein [Aquimarina addita]|uniref:Porin family protein n=1 Tax=Aquimarina addita TaxID=870485 RepID=A0ABP6USK9_9FLAO
MNRIVIITLLFLNSYIASAQLFSKERVLNNQNVDKDWISFGFILGFNSYDFDFDYKANASNTDIIVDKSAGFNVGLLSNLRINDYLDLRLEPMVTFSQRNLTYTNPDFNNSREGFREIKSTYVHIPLLLKVSTKRLNNFKPFIIGGVSTSLNLSSNENNPDDNSAGQFRTTNTTNYYELGFGIDFYLPYFKFTPSIRGIFAMSDELIRDNDLDSPYTSQIDKLSTRGIFLNFVFQ